MEKRNGKVLLTLFKIDRKEKGSMGIGDALLHSWRNVERTSSLYDRNVESCNGSVQLIVTCRTFDPLQIS